MSLSATNMEETKCTLRWPLILRFDYGKMARIPSQKEKISALMQQILRQMLEITEYLLLD
jgi:hypothetical protein